MAASESEILIVRCGRGSVYSSLSIRLFLTTATWVWDQNQSSRGSPPCQASHTLAPPAKETFVFLLQWIPSNTSTIGDEPRRLCFAVARLASISAFSWLYLFDDWMGLKHWWLKWILLWYILNSQFDPGWSPPNHSDGCFLQSPSGYHNRLSLHFLSTPSTIGTDILSIKSSIWAFSWSSTSGEMKRWVSSRSWKTNVTSDVFFYWTDGQTETLVSLWGAWIFRSYPYGGSDKTPRDYSTISTFPEQSRWVDWPGWLIVQLTTVRIWSNDPSNDYRWVRGERYRAWMSTLRFCPTPLMTSDVAKHLSPEWWTWSQEWTSHPGAGETDKWGL